MSTDLVQILDGNTFVVSDSRGDIEASLTDPTGLFSFDTRFLSRWVLTVNGERLNALSTDDLQYFETRFFLVPGTGTVYVDAKLSVIRQRAVGDGFSESLTILNHDEKPIAVEVRIEAGSDFADLFEVKDALKKKGTYKNLVERDRLVLRYQRDTYARETWISATGPVKIDEQGLTFTVKIEPHGQWKTDLSVVTAYASWGESRDRPKFQRAQKQARGDMARGLDKWLEAAPRLECDSDELRVTYRRSLVDMAALRFSTRTMPGRSLPAAGLPWFMTMFGRDSIFTSLQALPFAPELAATTLRALGERQGSRIDDFRDEDPGRILHEMRYGEMTAFEERPHSPYYGSADATPLYVVLLDEYERWTGDTRLVRDLEYEARAALNWIDEFGDLQGNGYVSYKRRNEKTGLENQCWKDSWDSISYRDGTLPGFPRATCELQGYAYDAKMRGAGSRASRLARPGLCGQAGEGGGRAQAPLQPRFLGRGRRVLRRCARRRRPPGRLADLEQRPSALERHRRQVEGEGGRASPHGSQAVLRLGRAHDGRGRGALQPHRLPRRDGLALRQLVHRLGPATLRLQGRGGPDCRRYPRRGRVLPRPSARSVRRLPAGDDEVPGPVPDRVQPAGLVDRHAAPLAPHDARPRARRGSPDRRPGAAQRHRPPRAARHPRALGPDRCLRARADRRREGGRPTLRGMSRQRKKREART